MTKEWVILLISALTDFVISTGTALTAAMVAKGDAQLPTWPVILLSTIGGFISFARTIQQNLRKSTSTETVKTETKTVTTAAPEEPKV